MVFSVLLPHSDSHLCDICHQRHPGPHHHHHGGRYSLIAPVQAGGNVTLHILHPVVGQMAHQHLPAQIQDFIHDVPQPMEEIAFISLGSTQTWKRWSVPRVSGEGGQVQLSLHVLATRWADSL